MATIPHKVLLGDLDSKSRAEVRLIQHRAEQIEEAEQITILEDGNDNEDCDQEFDENEEVDELGFYRDNPVLQAQTAAKFKQIMQS